jgi:hypothetical protein
MTFDIGKREFVCLLQRGVSKVMTARNLIGGNRLCEGQTVSIFQNSRLFKFFSCINDRPSS